MTQLKLKISKAPEKETTIDRLSKVLCKTYNGPIENRLFDGLFRLPYEKISGSYDEKSDYYYDSIVETDDGRKVPQIFHWRFWGYRAAETFEEMKKSGMYLEDYNI